MARRRFLAPLRADVPVDRFRQPLFSQLERFRSLFAGDDWPTLVQLNSALLQISSPSPSSSKPDPSELPRRFVEQSDALLADGLHYETRIHERGEIATRTENWHDLFNALVWLRHGELKLALNARQAAEVARIGTRQRSRAQEAMTQFDEAGCVVLLRDPDLLALWDAHDWPGLFWRQRDAWRDGRIELAVFGHALFEHALVPELLLVGKCLAVFDETAGTGESVVAVATAISDGAVLNEPAELRPLPLSGIAGWHPGTEAMSFYENAPCFRPRRVDRDYPPPIRCTA